MAACCPCPHLPCCFCPRSLTVTALPLGLRAGDLPEGLLHLLSHSWGKGLLCFPGSCLQTNSTEQGGESCHMPKTARNVGGGRDGQSQEERCWGSLGLPQETNSPKPALRRQDTGNSHWLEQTKFRFSSLPDTFPRALFSCQLAKKQKRNNRFKLK